MDMDIKVKKRDGRVVPFDSNKIRNAVQKAFKEVGVENDQNAAEYIERKIVSYVKSEYSDDDVPIDIEEIQDWVEDALLDFDRKTAKAYIKNRFYQEMERRFRYLFEV
jgi:anaerobic ribonucleoside-triphosphate reductase